MEARGFIFAPALAYRLGAGFVPVRKTEKLPAKTVSVSYALRIRHRFARSSRRRHSARPARFGICDDLLATGGTALATAILIEKPAEK